MSPELNALKRKIAAAGKREPADLVIRNGRIVNVFTGEIMEGDVAIADGVIVGIGAYDGKEIVDAQGRFIIPGFIDGHVHIESTLLTPSEFAKVSLLHGVTTVITDPHEIANVAGEAGIRYMLDDARDLPVDIFVMLPSCVPATPTEHNGARLGAEELHPFYKEANVLGLAEVMDFPSLARGDDGLLNKLLSAQQHGRGIDGHAAGIRREELNMYTAAGIRNDHEAIHAQEARDRLDLGMYLMIREGTVAKDLAALLPAVTPNNARRCLFVTDDVLIDDLLEKGGVDHAVRLAIAQGLEPITAIQMATLHAAECFGLRQIGAIAPGYQADFLLLDQLEQVTIHQVYKKGRCIANLGQLDPHAFPTRPFDQQLASALPKMNTKAVTLDALALTLHSDFCHIIEIIPNRLVTHHRKEHVQLKNGCFSPSVQQDQLKMAVIERHRATGLIGLGIVKGFGLKQGAIATSVSHDSHNIVAVGVSDEDILAAIQQVIRSNGGMAVVHGGDVLASLALPIGGVMSNKPYLDVYQELQDIRSALKELGASDTFDPFLTLSFLTLTVIPELKLTDQGLFEFSSFSYISLEA